MISKQGEDRYSNNCKPDWQTGTAIAVERARSVRYGNRLGNTERRTIAVQGVPEHELQWEYLAGGSCERHQSLGRNAALRQTGRI